MAVRTNLQSRRRRSGVGDIDAGNPLAKLREEERKKREREKKRDEDIERARRILRTKMKGFQKKSTLSPKDFERAFKSGLSGALSGAGVKIDFRKRKAIILQDK